MAKPILVVRCPIGLKDDGREKIQNHLVDKLTDYHVLTIMEPVGRIAFAFEVYNGVSGLKDIEVNKLIEEFNNNTPCK